MHLRQLSLPDFMDRAARVKFLTGQIVDKAHGDFDTNMLLDAVMAGTHRAYFYCNEDGGELGIIYTTITENLTDRILTIVGAAGAGANTETWGHLTRLFNDLAKFEECTRYEIRGRRGFMKTFKQHGWEEKFTTITRQVTDE